MRQSSTSALLLVSAFIAGCAQDTPTAITGRVAPEAAASSAQSAATCENVRGDIAGNFTEQDGFMMTGLGAAAVTVVSLDSKGNKAQGAIHSVVMHRISTSQGTIMTSDEGVLAPIAPPVYRLNHRWRITGGTGDFEGSTGFLHPHASIDLATGDITGFYHGRICT
jgi:hypothetical protein